jgi:hypothetical protein
MFHLMKTKKCYINVNETTLKKSSYQIIKQQYITIWPPTINESHTEQLASYRLPQNKSNAIKEKIMLSMRACQDCNAQFFLFILYINNFPFKYNVRVLSNDHIEVYS